MLCENPKKHKRQRQALNMGGKSSKAAAPAGQSENVQDSTLVTESGVVLSEDLQNKILQDFQSTVLKEEWEKRQKYLLAKNSKRRMQDYEFQEALKERMDAVRQQQASVQEKLDEKAQALQSRFADLSIGLQHEVERVEKENLSIQPKTGSSQPCLDVRKKLAACYQQNESNATECDTLVDELGMCIQLGVERINKEGQ